MSYLSLVAEFHAAFQYRQPEPRVPDLSCKATNALRPKLLREELQELQDAMLAGDKVAQLDALCDLQYVLSGAVLAWGFRGLAESLSYPRESRKIHDLPRVLVSISDYIDEMELCAQCNYPAQLVTMLHCAQSDLLRLVTHLGFASVFDDAFAEVHRSNLSKLFDAPDYKHADIYQMDATTGGKWIGRRADGKIVKSPSYSPARLEGFVK